jgi:hypothetical protein
MHDKILHIAEASGLLKKEIPLLPEPSFSGDFG